MKRWGVSFSFYFKALYCITMSVSSQSLFAKVNNNSILSGSVRNQHSDFIVDEIQSFAPMGEGEHVWLKIQKAGENTDWVAKCLAKIANVPRRDVGYAGKKDRHAVTTQWFSVHLPGKKASDWQKSLPETITVLEQKRHNKKLKMGALQGNCFEITISDFVGSEEQLSFVLNTIAKQGVPNYYGEQRFGFWNEDKQRGNNVVKAEQWFSQAYKIKDRNKRGLYLSAARSWVFNHILSSRVIAENWNKAITGDVFILDGSQSCFKEDITQQIVDRIASHDIHPSGALWGRGQLLSDSDVAELEEIVRDKNTILCEGLEKQGLKQERRSLRLLVDDISYKFIDKETVSISFSLPSGAYATSVLSEIGAFTNA